MRASRPERLAMSRARIASTDVYGEPALHVDKMELVINEDHWKAVCSDPWGGNIHRWSF
jgi:hypothetical protein